ncbi:hypothetical protein PR202_ga13149 [Eleusine coracana subsp. coracana]|uniref:Uncharacterized protein n=1 Tax=Eleusine coracana subsp. coracana TaxID=191504 RepID=A0AAV5CE04_ELECO|nr:hypothetical protein PR202_ga13149 [Eleusine coracana subsp. coracana]
MRLNSSSMRCDAARIPVGSRGGVVLVSRMEQTFEPRVQPMAKPKAFDGLAAPFDAFLDAACAPGAENKPDCVVVDNFHHWAAHAAVDRKLPCGLLLHCPASFLAAIAGKLRREPQPAAAPAFEAEQSRTLYTKEDESGISVAQRLFSTLQSSSLVAVRTCVELEPDALARLPTFFRKPVVPFGLLPRSPDERVSANAKDGDDAVIMSWLDAQPADSVVYVALGSEVPLRMDQVHELAHGLELAGPRFLWALRKPGGVLADVLPPWPWGGSLRSASSRTAWSELS